VRRTTARRPADRIGQTVAALGLLAVTLPGGWAQEAAWFERTYSVELVTTSPTGQRSHGALTVGDGRMRIDANEDDVPAVVLFEFMSDRVVMHMLDPVSTTVTTVAFERQGVAELDVLLMGALTVPPHHPAHPCSTHPAQATCAREGTATIAGRLAERWAVELGDGFGYREAFTLWSAVDEGLVVRTAYPDGYRVDFVGYAFGPQPPEAFAIPPDYEAR
jgi:hypothetical protein